MANWPIRRTIVVKNQDVATVSNKIVRADGSVTIEVAATLGAVTHTEFWTLPHDNPAYSQRQAQKDFETHLLKVATVAAGKSTAHSVVENLV